MPAPIRLRLFENYRFVLYAPFYAAHATGAYESEGLDIELLPSPGPGRAEAATLAGEADVMWMGPIRIMKAHEQDSACPLTAFAEIVCRDPFSLV
ncbi:MAG TPA: ABC transporter substrate-binding protein, partial [Stellaceae bacterium]|nr:ABC transporter substrate-binding protein [Stellaceae bacterium]